MREWYRNPLSPVLRSSHILYQSNLLDNSIAYTDQVFLFVYLPSRLISLSYILFVFLLPGMYFLPAFIVQINLQISEDYLNNPLVTKQVLSEISFTVVSLSLNFSDTYDLYLKLQCISPINVPYSDDRNKTYPSLKVGFTLS